MGRGDLHEAVAAGLVGGLLPRRHQRVVGPRERDPVDQHQLAGLPRHVEPLPQRQGAEQAGVRVLDELLGQLGQLRVALGEGRQVGQPLAHDLGRGLGRAARGEQPEGAPAGGVDQLADLVELGLPEAVAAGRRQVAGDVQDRLLAVVERRPDVDPAPGQHVAGAATAPSTLGRLEAERGGDGVEVAAEHQGRAGEDDGLVGEQLVAHRPPHLQRRDVQPRGDAVARLVEPQHVALEVGRHPLGVDEDLLHHALGLGAAGVAVAVDGVSLGKAERHVRAASRTSASASPSWSATCSIRPGEVACDRLGERVGGLAERVGRLVLDPALGAPRRPLDVVDGELVGRGLGDAGGELVGLVDDHGVVVGDHRHPLDRVDREQRVVGDDQVGALRLLPGALGEALQRRTGTWPRPGTRGG